MNKVIVIADSTTDLSKELIEKYKIKVVPLHVTIPGDDTDYLDGVNLDAEQIYEIVDKNGKTPKTGARNTVELIEDFRPYIEQGCDIIFTGIGASMSSTYSNACLAAQEFPEGRIEVIDSQNLSTGTGLLVLRMCELRDQGKDVHEIAKEIRELVPLVSAKFCIEVLDYLYKGGRCSGMTKLFAQFLRIHPIAKVIDGKLTMYKLPRGKYKKAVDLQIEEFVEDFNAGNIYPEHVFVTHSGRMTGETEYIVEELKKYLPEEAIHVTHSGCVVSSHCGPKTIGILYILKQRRQGKK
ncbi:MAG: DegV family protein [Bacilli bacterium]|nr:DegV family protein [Bacilli bacterium]